MTMHVLCSTDSKYIMPTSVMIKSVSVNNSNINIIFHVLIDESVKKYQKEQLSNVVLENNCHSVLFHVVENSMFNSFPNIGIDKQYITKATYYRLIIAELLDSDIEKVLYFDGDIIVDNSLIDLWNIDISKYAIGAVTDMSEQKQDFERLGYFSELGYFNAGVLLINLKYWREHNVGISFRDLMNNHPERIKLHDQDVLNIVFASKKMSLPFRYNCQNGFLVKDDRLEIDKTKYEKELSQVRNDFVVMHFSTRGKPWHKECDHPLKDLWFKYLKMTEWSQYKPIKSKKHSMREIIGILLRYFRMLPQLPPNENPYIQISR